jgi:hypothetical protein
LLPAASSVVFKDGSEEKVHPVMLATGHEYKMPLFDPKMSYVRQVQQNGSWSPAKVTSSAIQLSLKQFFPAHEPGDRKRLGSGIANGRCCI